MKLPCWLSIWMLTNKDVRTKERDDKSTKETYARHMRHYESFWQTTSYAKGDPPRGIAPISALFFTVAKAVVFLQYESTPPQKKRKRKGADCDDDKEEASSVDLSGIKQVISALEDWRRHTTTSCRTKIFLKHKSAFVLTLALPRSSLLPRTRLRNVSRWLRHSKLKALRLLNTYTFQELIRCSVSCMTDSRGSSGIFVDLTSTSVAFRGDSSRSLLWSDQFLFNAPILAKGLDATIPALTLIADNAKHNQNGRIEEYGAFRHRHVEVCPVGAIAALFFAWFHVLNCPVPDFKPDFTDVKYGQFGRRDWYSFHVFSHAKQVDKPMTYDNHRDRLNAIYAKNDISISKVTHAGRGYAVKVSREHGASVAGAKALGG
ncbi:NDC10-II domain-containing protein [Mycena venus]|uniref:NDC10-II domain-containing protein n=1 Tax=Mycena venus TaxID=2733690 RepID=A0A8H7DC45_9AGAR|nr:NDC10-II domain-containing protein [Mycena venus]